MGDEIKMWNKVIKEVKEEQIVRGPESILITGSPYKVIIRALQLVLHYVLVKHWVTPL